MISIRAERPEDLPAIRHVNEMAFERPDEADLVDALRGSDAWLPELSLVAEDESGIVGHALFSLVQLDSGPDLLSLAPMAVASDRQRAGIGSSLIRHGLELAQHTEYPLVVVLGHPAYYPRFGFESGPGPGHRDAIRRARRGLAGTSTTRLRRERPRDRPLPPGLRGGVS